MICENQDCERLFTRKRIKNKTVKVCRTINVPFVCLVKEAELAENKVTLKDMRTGVQETIEREDIAAKIKQ
jgi:histidyl-tRNA synthetase